ncbi:MAG: phenylalanine--tRNA ligase subunit beta [bacterium]
MKILYNWLKEFVSIELTPEELAEKLVALGFSVDSIETAGADFEGVRVAEILKIDRHPNADRLSLCDITDGEQRLTVVCGAKNIAVGQKVPFAKAGARLPGGILQKAKIRGVESQGMICAAGELGLKGCQSDGIMVLLPDTVTGSDVSSLFPEKDRVLEVDVMPNRPDCLSHMGMARELAASLGLPLMKPGTARLSCEEACMPVSIREPELCPRYCGMVVRNVAAAMSPAWLAWRLEAMGSRPRNLLVDVTNYVLYELGQPLHAFDTDLLRGQEITVRRALPGERLLTLEEKTLELRPDWLVIADRERPVALAGVMGGLETAVSGKTRNIFLESACFNPVSIRKTSVESGIKTESSHRFERGTDPEAASYACLRAAELITRACSGAAASKLSDTRTAHPERPSMEISAESINSILGTSLPDEKILSCLKTIDPSLGAKDPNCNFTPPSWRRDISTVWDAAEEVARILGYDVIPAAEAPVPMGGSGEPASVMLCEKLRSRLVSSGFCEIYTYDFVSARELASAAFETKRAVRLANPLSCDWEYLRPSLLPGLLRALSHNANRGVNTACLFELATVYDMVGKEPRERLFCAGIMYGTFPAAVFWKKERVSSVDFFHLKAAVSRLLRGFSRVETARPERAPALFHPGLCLEVSRDDSLLGCYGRLHPSAAQAWELKNPDAWIFEFCLDPLSRHAGLDFFSSAPRVSPVSNFPSSWRDISVVLESATPWEKVLAQTLAAAGPSLANTNPVDLYEGKGIPEGFKSLSVRLTFSLPDRTLTDTEVDKSVGRILETLSSSLGAKLRT